MWSLRVFFSSSLVAGNKDRGMMVAAIACFQIIFLCIAKRVQLGVSEQLSENIVLLDLKIVSGDGIVLRPA